MLPREVKPELLDALPSADPRAIGSRADLRRLNSLMDHAGILARAFRAHHPNSSNPAPRLRVAELGAGDGTLFLKLARRWSANGVAGKAILLDRQNLVSDATHRDFHAINWEVECVAADVFEWLEHAAPPVDVMLANLFLHHFTGEQLRPLLRLAAVKTDLFLACEPCRSPLALNAARLLGLIGCNAVTRHDAVVSVRAGFAGDELSTLWPPEAGWQLDEHPAGLFSHGFRARRKKFPTPQPRGEHP